MNARDTLQLQYDGLENGCSLAGELCPACNGGSTKEGSLSVSKREGILLWQCHRASCGFKGASGGHRSQSKYLKELPTRGTVGRWIAAESEMVDEPTRQLLASQYGITENHISKYSIGWDPNTERLVLPVEDVRSERLGVVLRSLKGEKPKTLTHTEKDAIAWYVNTDTPDIIIVEDQLSAIRASDYLTSVALLGTHLNENRVSEIRRASGNGRVYLALDGDAWATAVKYAILYRNQLKLQLVKLNKDLKNQTDEELSNLIASLKKE